MHREREEEGRKGKRQAQWETVAYFKHKSNNKYLHASAKVTKKRG